MTSHQSFDFNIILLSGVTQYDIVILYRSTLQSTQWSQIIIKALTIDEHFLTVALLY